MVSVLGRTAKKEGKTESEILRRIIAAYLKDTDERKVPYEPYRKTSPAGLRALPRTILKEQDIKLRDISGKTGRGISELVREAVKEFFVKA